MVAITTDVCTCASQGYPANFTGEVLYRRIVTNGQPTSYTLLSTTCVPPAAPAPVVGPVITTNNIVSSCQANGYGPGYTGQIVYAEQLTNGVRTSCTGVSNTCTAPPPKSLATNPPPVPPPSVVLNTTTELCKKTDIYIYIDIDIKTAVSQNRYFAYTSSYYPTSWLPGMPSCLVAGFTNADTAWQISYYFIIFPKIFLEM